MKNLMICLALVSVLLSPVMARDFKIEMPVRVQDIAQSAYGILPFGVHSGTIDGNPGFDIEFRYGSFVYVAADGVVQSVAPDTKNPGAVTVTVTDNVDGKDYRTIYSNILDLAPSIAPGIPIQAGQTLGKPGQLTQTVGFNTVTIQSIHFQVEDMSANNGGANPNAVSPELFLTDNGKSVLKEIWKTAKYPQAIFEPFATNQSSATAGSDVRVWSLASGTGAPRIRLTRTDISSPNYQYEFLEAYPSDTVLEKGTAVIDPYKYDFEAVDFQPTSGQNGGGFGPHFGLFEVRGDSMRLDYSQPNMLRPNNLNKASLYTTTNP